MATEPAAVVKESAAAAKVMEAVVMGLAGVAMVEVAAAMATVAAAMAMATIMGVRPTLEEGGRSHTLRICNGDSFLQGC